MVDLKSLSSEELVNFIESRGLPRFRAKQLLHWIYEKKVEDIRDITELSRQLREDLSKEAYISNLLLCRRAYSTDGTEKFLFQLEDGERIESVLIPDEQRLTLCISSQVGCPLGCRFCLTGKIGFRRNLKAHEIVDQFISVQRIIGPRKITNLVLMGMGEPLLNLDEVAEAIRRITEYMRFSRRRITLSTAGIVPGIRRLPQVAPLVNLAISLNATTDKIRDQIMPINKKYPISELLKACREFPLEPRKRITFEYVLLKGVNDTTEDAERLVKLLRGIPSKVNLIPFNPYQRAEFEKPDDEETLRFQNVLLRGGLTALIRKSRGSDILAACGQLRAEYKSPKVI
jgi:23S rRNA (adenine2503-C2)-methyltransferase